MELGDAVDLPQLHPVLDIEFQVEVVGRIQQIVEEAGEQFHILLWQPPRVVPASFHIPLSQDTGRHWDSLRSEGIVVVCVVAFRWRVQVTLVEIAGGLIFSLPNPVDPAQLLLAKPGESSIPHGETHSFAIEIVGVAVDYVGCRIVGSEERPHIFVIGFRVSAADHGDTSTHRIRLHRIHLCVGDEFQLPPSLL